MPRFDEGPRDLGPRIGEFTLLLPLCYCPNSRYAGVAEWQTRMGRAPNALLASVATTPGGNLSDNDVRLGYLLDSLKDAFVFCDLDHVIRYMNKAAFVRYEGRPAVVGRSIFDCHNAKSNAMIVSIVERFLGGVDEAFLSDRKGERIFMRAVRDETGALVGYYERYEVSCSE